MRMTRGFRWRNAWYVLIFKTTSPTLTRLKARTAIFRYLFETMTEPNCSTYWRLAALKSFVGGGIQWVADISSSYKRGRPDSPDLPVKSEFTSNGILRTPYANAMSKNNSGKKSTSKVAPS